MTKGERLAEVREPQIPSPPVQRAVDQGYKRGTTGQ